VSLTLCVDALHFLILCELKSPTEDGGAAAPASPHWPDNSTTGALERLTPNSTPNNYYPSTNFKILAPNLSAHGDNVINDNSKCSRWSYAFQLNWPGREASQAHRDSKTRERRTWSDLWRADRGELTHAVFLTDLGEISNWGALVDDLGHGLLYWVRDYLAEPMARSIYRARGQWLVNLKSRAGGRRERRTLVG
jgi:hypothetical protein